MGEVVNCSFCSKKAVWVENKAVYGRNYGKSFMCWLCKDCDAYVGCHNNTRRPLGTMADDQTRKWRQAVHRRIDPLWKSGDMSRKEVYKKISDGIGFQFHTGEADVETCKKVLEFMDRTP